MRKRLMLLLMALMLLPAAAFAELEYIQQEKKFIDFPTLDGWRGHFASVKKWTIVTPETLDEHLDMVLKRGDSEAEVRARYARENFLFEAYSPDLFPDACFRAEMYESDFTRDVWHLRHVGGQDRQDLLAYIESGKLLPDREIYSLRGEGSNNGARLMGCFTNFPKDAQGNPQRHESGQIQFSFYNGRMYVFSYCVSGRLAGGSSRWSNKEDEGMNKLPMGHSESAFQDKALPRLPKYTLNEPLPILLAPGDVTFTGTVEKGSAITATLDGAEVPVSLDKQNKFTLTATLPSPGSHELIVTVTNKKFTTRTMTYALEAADDRTPLTILEAPEYTVLNGDLAVKGNTDPGADVSITLDGAEPVHVTADSEGVFTHTLTIDDAAAHALILTATTPGKTPTEYATAFATEYKTVQAGIAAFSEDGLEDISVYDLVDDPQSYVGKKIKLSVTIRDIELTEEGLGLACYWQNVRYKKYDPRQGTEVKKNIYVTVPGYAQCQLYENMTISVYGVVQGEKTYMYRDKEEMTSPHILMDYGTYLQYRKSK